MQPNARGPWSKTKAGRKILGSEDEIASLLEASGIQGLRVVNDIIRQEKAASADWYLSLDDASKQQRRAGVYGLVFAKNEEKSVYIGSAVGIRGFSRRMSLYKRFVEQVDKSCFNMEKWKFIPKSVMKSVADRRFQTHSCRNPHHTPEQSRPSPTTRLSPCDSSTAD